MIAGPKARNRYAFSASHDGRNLHVEVWCAPGCFVEEFDADLSDPTLVRNLIAAVLDKYDLDIVGEPLGYEDGHSGCLNPDGTIGEEE